MSFEDEDEQPKQEVIVEEKKAGNAVPAKQQAVCYGREIPDEAFL